MNAPRDLEARALWHLELDPVLLYADASFDDFANAGLPPAAFLFEDDCDDYDERDDYACTHCGGEGYREVDDIWWDPCDEFGYGPCSSCRGTGERRHQWVF